MVRTALAVLVVLWAAPALGQKAGKPVKDQVSFHVEATREVPNDWVVATLGMDAEGNDAAALARRVNERMAGALALAREVESIQVSSGGYQTQPVYDRGKLARWRARQDLVIEGGDLDAVTELVGRLQSEELVLRGVSFSVSPETQEDLEEELIVEALTAFRQRAGLIARGIGRRGWNLVSANIGQHDPPMPYLARGRTMALEASAEAPPALASGKSTLRITVDATIEVE